MKSIGQLLKISILAAIIAIGSIGVAQAFNPQPDPPGSVAVGITTSQTARISVANVSNHLRFPPDPCTPPDPCHVRLSFFDSQGNTLRVMEDTVRPGQVISMDLCGIELELPDTKRLQIYALVEYLVEYLVEADSTLRKVKDNASIKSGLELFDSRTGVSTLALPVVGIYKPAEF